MYFCLIKRVEGIYRYIFFNVEDIFCLDLVLVYAVHTQYNFTRSFGGIFQASKIYCVQNLESYLCLNVLFTKCPKYAFIVQLVLIEFVINNNYFLTLSGKLNHWRNKIPPLSIWVSFKLHNLQILELDLLSGYKAFFQSVLFKKDCQV